MENIFEPIESKVIIDKYVDDKFIEDVLEKFKVNNINVSIEETKTLINLYITYYLCDTVEGLSVEMPKEYYIMFARHDTSLDNTDDIVKTIDYIRNVFHNKVIINSVNNQITDIVTCEKITGYSQSYKNMKNIFDRLDELISAIIDSYGDSNISYEFNNVFIRGFDNNVNDNPIRFILVNKYNITDIDNLIMKKSDIKYSIFIAHRINSLDTLASIPNQSTMYGNNSYFILGSIPKTIENGVQILMSESHKRNMFLITDKEL